VNISQKQSDKPKVSSNGGNNHSQQANDVANVEFVVVDSLQQLINSGWNLDQALELISLQNDPAGSKCKPPSSVQRIDRSSSGDGLLNDVGIVDSLETLLREGAEIERTLEQNKKRIAGFANLNGSNEDEQVASIEANATEEVPHERVSFFSESFLANWTNDLSTFLDSGVTIAVLNSRRKVCHIQYAGWDSAPFRVHGELMNNSARIASSQSAIFQSASLYSSADKGKSRPKNGDNRDPRNSVCVLLNRLSKNVGHELIAISQKLENANGKVVLFLDSSSIDANRLEEMVLKPEWKNRIHELDAWFLIRRFQWSVRLNSAIEWILSHPKSLLGIAALLIAILFIPIPYYPSRTCVIEPESRQHIVSPVAGKIASCETRPGDLVKTGQLLVRLDDEQIQRDLAAAQAEYQRATKKLESAMANRQQGEATLAKIEILKAESILDSLKSQLSDLEIKSTSTGIVIQGDWNRSLGMPVTMGQNLFEIAELSSLVAEVHLNAEDLGQIRVGDTISVRADSAGTERFSGNISRIEPRASISDEGVFFVADVMIQDAEQRLRPGMKATAVVDAGWKSIGWLLFSRPYRWLANQWVW
jgi:hypothetical protein